MKKPYISKIRVYPVKSLDPIEVNKAEIGIHSLRYDREFAMVADDRRYVNAKRTGRVNQLKATYDLPNQRIFLSHRDGGEINDFELRENNKALEKYLEDFFNMKLTLYHRTRGELMDIPKASSITIVSEASLQSLHQDFSDHTLEDLRLRFRANIEIGGVDPYWEEKLFGEQGIGFRFLVGNVEMIGVSPRARCNVPPRDPFTGETDKTFVKTMLESRSKSLPTDSLLSNYGSLYHLTVNTFVPESEKGKIITVGDEIEIIEPVRLQ